MKLLKNILSLVLVATIVASCVFGMTFSANAADVDNAETGAWSSAYNLTGNGAKDMVSIAWAQEGKTGSDLGYTFDWCAAFVGDCAKRAGQTAAVPYRTFVSDLYAAVTNAGGYRVSTAQAGDLVFYYCTTYQKWAHVAIMTDSVNSIHGNVGAVKYIDYRYFNDSAGKCYDAIFVRPNYQGSTAAFGTPADLGDNFYASLAKNDSGVYLANVNGNIELANKDALYDDSYIWKFVRQSDNSYILYNCAGGGVLDVANAGTTEGTNISMCPLNSSDAQKWYFYKQSNGSYVIRPKLCYLVMDANGGYNDIGTNIQLWTYNQSAAQMFSLIKQPTVNTPSLTVEAGDYRTLTTFKCTTDVNPIMYDLVINTVNGDNVTHYKTVSMVQNATFMYELPVGVYKAYAVVSNGYSSAESNKVTFSVVSKPVIGDDGWTYSDKLYSDVTSANYEIQYLHTYSKVASESPGAGWVKGDLVKREYVNSGDPYWSDIELATSDTVVLVNYIYYHYCGASTDSDANFAPSGGYVHYDWLSKDGVYEYSVKNDYDDSRYKFYHLKWSNGSDAYCSSGTSCDGSAGSHGNRSCYWYKSSQYQNKVAVDYYEYTKPSVWTTTYDSSAQQVTYRYKLKDSTVFGDANGDGKVTVVDATMIQKNSASLITLSEKTLAMVDVDRNGRVNVADATKIQKYIAGIISAL